MSKVKTVRITHFSLFFSTFFTRITARGIDGQRFTTTAPAKVTTKNGANRAGATPLFGCQSAQKFLRVAPALGGTSDQRVLRRRVGQPREVVRQHV